MRHIFIINPAAGRGDLIERLEEKIKLAFEKRAELEYEIYKSQSVGDAQRYVSERCNEEKDEEIRFYACGGDGTVNEVFSGTVGAQNAEVAVIPIGTGNDFIKNFGSADHFMDISAQIDGKSSLIDGIRVNDRYAVNLVNMGFDCAVVESVQKIKRKPMISSGLAYVAGVVIEFVKMPGVKLKSFFLDGKKVEKDELFLCAFANGGFYGGGFHCAPLARTDDGIIDFCLVKPVTRLQFATMIAKYKKGTYLESKRIMKYVEYHKCKSASIDFDGEVSVCLDGEITKMSHIDIEICPNAFRLSLPSGIINKTSEKNKYENIGAL
ncbi:MAG: diacylglycerol kinase family lipid kinase [Clostridia bacterium]|nr:diacylglycerol kinase family lipid kinase [Clostridia bacterium]